MDVKEFRSMKIPPYYDIFEDGRFGYTAVYKKDELYTAFYSQSFKDKAEAIAWCWQDFEKRTRRF